MTSSTRTIDNFGPLPCLAPATPEEVGEIVRRARAENQAIYPVGGGTRLDLGYAPVQPGWAVDVTGLSRIIDYPARDMTITVQTGIRVADLQATLAGENQRLPIDVPRAGEATLGGILAANTSGPRRYGFGTLRDYLIGISYITDEGQEAKAGGRVVKNVAGYDLCKLHIGALGTLGVLTQATLKLRPIPEEQAVITFGCYAEQLGTVLDLLHASRTRPVCIETMNRAMAGVFARRAEIELPDTPWVLAVGYEESKPAVGWQIDQIKNELAVERLQGVEARLGKASQLLWRELGELTAPLGDATVMLKANLLPSGVASLGKIIDAFPERFLVQAHAGSGIVRIQSEEDLPQQRFRDILRLLQTHLADGYGNLVVGRCPAAWKAELPIWGKPRGDWPLMEQVKRKIDPHGLFNPGRFIPPASRGR